VKKVKSFFSLQAVAKVLISKQNYKGYLTY